jgi:heme oxygenase
MPLTPLPQLAKRAAGRSAAGSTQPQSDTSSLAALRAATQARHSAAERVMPLSRPNPSLDDYREHLQITRAWLEPLESWLRQFADGPQGPHAPPARQRISLILADLADIDGSSETAQTLPPLKPCWPNDAPCAYRWGICYVVEGSQLGGATLYRRLAPSLSPHPLRYLRSGLDETRARWPQFLSALSAHLGPSTIAIACSGAADAFDSLLRVAAGSP